MSVSPVTPELCSMCGSSDIHSIVLNVPFCDVCEALRPIGWDAPNARYAPVTVTLAKLSGTRMVTDMSVKGRTVWIGTDWDYPALMTDTHDMYQKREMSGLYPSVSFYGYLVQLSEFASSCVMAASPGLHRSHCSALFIMIQDMMSRIDRESAELSRLLNSDIWNDSY